MEEEIGFNIDKEKDFSEWFNEILKAAELGDQRYGIKGFIVHMPNAAVTERVMYRMFEDELEKRGHKPTRFPSLIPSQYFEKEAEHIEGFAPEVFWVTHGGTKELEEKLAMRPTSETAMYTMYANWIRSHRDLPLKIYQSCQVWRFETKHTRPFLRDREFHWIEAHDVFATKEEAEKQVLEDMEITERVMHEQMGIPFFFFKRPEWDKFSGAEYTFGSDVLMPDKKVIQQPSTHFLSQGFAKVFGIRFVDEDEKEKIPYQTCYGPAISRIYSSLIGIHGDNKGLVLPFDLAPTQVVITPVLFKGNEEKVLEKCREVKDKINALNYRVELDDSDKTPGNKYYYWELRGAAVRIEIGAKELENGTLTVVRRDTGEKEKISEKDLKKYLSGVGKKILKNLKEKADKWFKGNVRQAGTMDELGKALDQGGFVRVNFCSRDMDGIKCADEIGEKLHAEVRGTLHGKEEKPSGNCIVCGKQAKEVVYVARSY